jgi:cell wall-associated NlpC family hydrolase
MTKRIVKRLSARKRTALIAAARSYIGVPYQHRGRTRRGVDCIGLLACAFADIGVSVVEPDAYSPIPDGQLLHAGVASHLGEPVTGPLRPGDVVLLRWHQHPNHVALVTDYPIAGELALLHSYAKAERVVEHRLADPWPRRIVAAWRP